MVGGERREITDCSASSGKDYRAAEEDHRQSSEKKKRNDVRFHGSDSVARLVEPVM